MNIEISLYFSFTYLLTHSLTHSLSLFILEQIHPLPRTFPSHCRTKKYVHDYVQAYYSESLDSFLVWVKSHAKVYTLDQIKTLGQCCVAVQSMKSKKQVRLFTEKIEAMYRIGRDSEGDRKV